MLRYIIFSSYNMILFIHCIILIYRYHFHRMHEMIEERKKRLCLEVFRPHNGSSDLVKS